MKRFLVLVLSLILSVTTLCGCIMIIPNDDSIGESKVFEKAGLSILLTDKFVEQESQKGFDAYYVSDFCGVMVLKEPFSWEEGLAECPLEEYIRNVIRNNGHTDVEPINEDGLWYYKSEAETTVGYSYCYKGSDAFYIVQYRCYPSDAKLLEDFFYLSAASVEVE